MLLPGFVLGGIGIGLTNPALASTAVGVAPPRAIGHGLRHEQHLPPGRDRDRDRRPGRAVPALDRPKLTTPERAAPGHDLVAAVASGAFPTIAPEARAAFVDSLGSILTIAAIVALAGAVLVVVLLRHVRPPHVGARAE